jgi:hypothetical protein
MECCGCVEKASPEVWMDDVEQRNPEKRAATSAHPLGLDD